MDKKPTDLLISIYQQPVINTLDHYRLIESGPGSLNRLLLSYQKENHKRRCGNLKVRFHIGRITSLLYIHIDTYNSHENGYLDNIGAHIFLVSLYRAVEDND